MPISIRTICCGQLAENAYLVCPEGRDDCLLIDPGDGLEKIKRAIEDSGRRLTDILLTHAHFDHMLSAPHFKRFTGARLHVHALDVPMLTDAQLNLFQPAWCYLPLLPVTPDVIYEGDSDFETTVCGQRVTVMHTPGHTPGGVCYHFTDEKVLFSGDTVFAQGYGRVDFPGGDVKQLTQSLKRIVHMPEDIQVYSGHGGPADIHSVTRGLIR